jgi:Asp-tRNA(Asn)/Glu-tRNA(Gln) amidotransferase A subunit family amidase
MTIVCETNKAKPTWNTVSTEGMSHYSINLDTIGYFARTADDLEYLAIFFDRIKVLPRALPSHLGDIRIGLLQTHVWPKAGQGLKSIWDKIRVILACEGATISDLTLPMQFSSHPDYYAHVIASDAYSSFLGYALRSPHGLHRAILATVSKGTEITPKVLQKTYDDCAMLRSLWDAIADQYDIIITPSVPEEAPQGLEYTGDASFCSLWTLLHAPVVNVPGMFSKNGLPIGISIVGSRWNDDKVIWGSKVITAILKRHSMAINLNQLQIQELC